MSSIFGRGKPPPPEPEPTVEPEPHDEDLQRKLEMLDPTLAWRARHLLDMRFTLEQTLVLAKLPDVVHDARALIDQGCPVHIAFDLLSP